MLKRDQSIIVYEGGRARPDRLFQAKHAHYREYGTEMLAQYREGIGRTRGELHDSVERIFEKENNCDPRRIRAFCRILDEASEYDVDRSGTAARLRYRVFSLAAARHPFREDWDENIARNDLARALGRPWREIEAALYDDFHPLHRLKAFRGFRSPEELLSRYNVAQVQACLYRAEKLVIDAARDFKFILRHAKLARLLHRIRRTGASRYRIELSGPAAALRGTCRYGINLARFLPGLLACRDWSMLARVRTPWGAGAKLGITSKDGLRSHLPTPEEFDSRLERNFANSFGPERGGWRLFREAEILHDGQTTFVPDFVIRHEGGFAVILEIAGFWTKEYLVQKRKVLERFKNTRLLMALAERSGTKCKDFPCELITFKDFLAPEAVLEALERMRKEERLI